MFANTCAVCHICHNDIAELYNTHTHVDSIHTFSAWFVQLGIFLFYSNKYFSCIGLVVWFEIVWVGTHTHIKLNVSSVLINEGGRHSGVAVTHHGTPSLSLSLCLEWKSIQASNELSCLSLARLLNLFSQKVELSLLLVWLAVLLVAMQRLSSNVVLFFHSTTNLAQ